MFSNSQPIYLSPPDAELIFVEHFYSPQESKSIFQSLRTETKWQEESITIYGKQYMQPRLLAWYGDEGAHYAYSGRTYQPFAWNETLLDIKRKVESFSGHEFNSCLLNLYRNGQDSMGWHSDDEKELGKNPVIASVTFGAARTFKLQHKKDKAQKLSFELTDGSLLIMKGTAQHYWKHAVPKTTKNVGERINLTFRKIH